MADAEERGRAPDPALLTSLGAQPHAGAGGLAILGLKEGETVRWRSAAGGRWQTGAVVRRERDGSVGVTDRRGMARSFAVERLEVACSGRRGAKRWEPLPERAARSEQLRLL